MAIEFNLNGNGKSVAAPAQTPLLEVLRNDLGLHGPKFGCGLGQCGACTVLVNGHAVRSCIIPYEVVEGKHVTTLEGIGSADKPHLIQTAFLDQQAAQCGYCASGIITAIAGMLEQDSEISSEQIISNLSGHLCRCGSQPRMIKAIEQVVNQLAFNRKREHEAQGND